MHIIQRIHFNLLVCGDSSDEQDILFGQMILGTLVFEFRMGSLFCPNRSLGNTKFKGCPDTLSTLFGWMLQECRILGMSGWCVGMSRPTRHKAIEP